MREARPVKRSNFSSSAFQIFSFCFLFGEGVGEELSGLLSNVGPVGWASLRLLTAVRSTC